MPPAGLEAEAAFSTPPRDAAALEALSEQEAMPWGTEPWVLLASQWAGARAASASAEKRLLAAVLADAIRLYLKHAHSRTVSGRLLFRDTAGWVESRDRSWLLSYASVCEVLGIDAGRLRNRLRTLAASEEHRALPFDAGRLRTGQGRKIRI